MTAASLPEPAAPSIYRSRTLGDWVLLALAVLLGIGGGIVSPLVAALLTSDLRALGATGLVVCFLIAHGLARRATGGLPTRQRLLLPLGVGVATALLLLLIAALALTPPLAASSAPVAMPAQARYWDLPTGSRLAFLRIPAQGTPKATPIIRLHGGPGAYAVTNTPLVELIGRLAQDGYDIYFYDQVGSGLSRRLSDPRQYTVARHIDDLEGVRQAIGADKVILLADSWGATLAAGYMAVHPEHVARAILVSPAPLNYAEWPDMGDISERLSLKEQAKVQALLNRPRFAVLTTLWQINPQAAYNLAPDREVDAFFDEISNHVMAGAACLPAGYASAEMTKGLGFWANLMTVRDAGVRSFDVRSALILNRTPLLILRGECDYLKWEIAYQYKTTLPNATLLSVPRSGHAIYYDEPDLYLAAIRAFLLDQPLPLKPYSE